MLQDFINRYTDFFYIIIIVVRKYEVEKMKIPLLCILEISSFFTSYKEKKNNQDFQETFQWSIITISFLFHKVLTVLLILYKKTIRLFNLTLSLDRYIVNDIKYFFYLEDCLKVLDDNYLHSLSTSVKEQ